MRVSETLHNQHFGLAKLTTIGEGSGLCVGTFLGAKNTSATINLEIHFFLIPSRFVWGTETHFELMQYEESWSSSLLANTRSKVVNCQGIND